MPQSPSTKPPAEPPQPAESPQRKSFNVKTIVAVVVLLILEAGMILGGVKLFGTPSPVKGVGLEASGPDEGEMLEEIPVLHEKFTNSASGRVWIWDTEVIIKVKRKHAGPAESDESADKGHSDKTGHPASEHAGMTVRKELKARAAEIRTGIGAIISGAQHAYFTEPGRETLSRQVLQYMRSVLGHDAEGNERVVEALIPRCLGFPADY